MYYYIFIFIGIIFTYFFVGKAPISNNIVWGINFSQKQAQDMGLNWQENYSALIDDLGVKNIKLAVYWDLIEPSENQFSFQDLDWQIKKAEENNVNLILVIGMKVPRWPECHIPEWAKDKSKIEQQEEILEMLNMIVSKYKNSPAIKFWQVENEPFFPFGQCPWTDKEFVKKEINLVKSIDPQRPIIISDSGEGSFWIQAAQFGDVVGTTIYRQAWFNQLNKSIKYHLPGVFYWRKAQLVKLLFNKEVICVELQAEPWGPNLIYNLSVDEQAKTMNLKQFEVNVEFAKTTGLKEFYFWGSEWWYWMKEKQNLPDIWNKAKELFY
ncbi:beta-galactosidase [Patescibacteria group bacterium]|nr:beta-galactosidase [Patescibacteria group bacterium]MBU1877113.1 beta-galactosidase [Patescibacteria group bacterium]